MVHKFKMICATLKTNNITLFAWNERWVGSGERCCYVDKYFDVVQLEFIGFPFFFIEKQKQKAVLVS